MSKNGAQRFADKRMMTFFGRSQEKRSLSSLYEKICKFGEVRAKILNPSKKFPAPPPV